MSLFNEYQNKNFTFLTRYINGIINDSKAMTEEELQTLLIGTNLLTKEDFTKGLSNQKEKSNENALIFNIDKDDCLIPIINIPIPVRATRAERAWLYYYIQKPEAELFLDKDVIDTLKKSLEVDDYNLVYPLNDSTFETKDFYIKKPFHVTFSLKENFNIVFKAINEKRFITTDNHTAKGTVYKDSKMVPFRFEYVKSTGAIYISAYIEEAETGRSIKLNINNLSNTRLGDKVEKTEDYELIKKKYLESLNKDLDIIPPVTIKITDHFNGFDRTVFTFANYKRESYRDEDHNIIMKIYYRRFQKRDIIEKLLFLGSAVTVLGPDSIIQEYVSILKETLNKYK